MTKAGSSSLLNAYYGELYYSVALVSRRTDRRESRRRTTFPIKSTLPHQRANKCQEEALRNPSYKVNVCTVGDMPKSPSSQCGLKAQKDIDPREIKLTNRLMR